MTNIKKGAAAFFVLMMMFVFVPSQTNAQTTSQLQLQINQLLAQVAALQAQLAQLTGGATCTVTFTRNLGVGALGADVLALQRFLNGSADTRVAVSGAGSPGFETQYYGPATAGAVSRFQVKYRSEILTPAGLVNPTGYFGPSSRAKVNTLCTVTPPVTPPSNNNGNNDSDTGALKGGEASLSNFDVNDGDDTSLSEGQNNGPVMDVEFDVDDGDIRIDRIDVAFDRTSADGDEDPWDVFDTVSIWANGKKIAEKDVSDDAAWDEDEPENGDYRVRLTDIDYVVREGDTAAFTVAVSPANTVEDAGAVTWETFIPDEGVRAVDSLNLSHYEGETSQTVQFDIGTEGEGDDLVVQTSSEDPDASVLEVNRSSASDWLKVFAFQLDADDSEDDVTINSLPITVDLTDSENYDDIVRDARLVVDGETYDEVTIDNGNTDTAVLTFDIGHDDLVIDAGDSVDVELELEFNALAEADEGTRVQAYVTGSQADDIDAEGADDLSASQISGTATGEIHTLRTGGTSSGDVTTDAVLKTNSSATTDDDEGVFTVEFEVAAFEQDVYIDNTAARGTTTSTAGVNYILEDSSGDEVTSGSVSANLDATADLVGGRYRVLEGETETFTLTVEYDPADSGFYKLQLYTINYNDTSADPDTYQRALPESKFETESLSI